VALMDNAPLPIALLRCGTLPEARADSLQRALAERGVAIDSRGTGATLLLLGSDGLAEATERLRDTGPSTSASTSVLVLNLGPEPLPREAPWHLLDAGAADVLDGLDDTTAAHTIAARAHRWHEVDRLIDTPTVREHLLGHSSAWRRLLRQLVEVAAFSDAHIHLSGDSGTGKELAARLVHTLSRRPGSVQPLVVLDCTTVVPELAGSEFFGHERGAFTGALQPRDGAFALADGGTLFLDEVGELSAAMQPQLLRVIQEKSFKRVGGSAWQTSRFRLVSATLRDLQAEVARGSFRNDLYWRLAACSLQLPTLAERRDDIPLLAERFLAEALHERQAPGAECPVLAPPVLDHLVQRAYPGNVRELRQLMHRIAARHVGPGPITVGDLPEAERAQAPAALPDWRGADFDHAIQRALGLGVGLRDISAEAANTAIRIAIGEAGGNLQRAARRLGVTDRALQLRRASAGSITPPG
jgi:transcriptional regulator with GAF, ATPase, and Fis domain